jgi:large subunit ribosomal protein L20
LWKERLSAALRVRGSKYSLFIGAMLKKDIRLNRKVLSNVAIAFPEVFDKIYAEVLK